MPVHELTPMPVTPPPVAPPVVATTSVLALQLPPSIQSGPGAQQLRAAGEAHALAVATLIASNAPAAQIEQQRAAWNTQFAELQRLHGISDAPGIAAFTAQLGVLERQLVTQVTIEQRVRTAVMESELHDARVQTEEAERVRQGLLSWLREAPQDEFLRAHPQFVARIAEVERQACTDARAAFGVEHSDRNAIVDALVIQTAMNADNPNTDQVLAVLRSANRRQLEHLLLVLRVDLARRTPPVTVEAFFNRPELPAATRERLGLLIQGRRAEYDALVLHEVVTGVVRPPVPEGATLTPVQLRALERTWLFQTVIGQTGNVSGQNTAEFQALCQHYQARYGQDLQVVLATRFGADTVTAIRAQAAGSPAAANAIMLSQAWREPNITGREILSTLVMLGPERLRQMNEQWASWRAANGEPPLTLASLVPPVSATMSAGTRDLCLRLLSGNVENIDHELIRHSLNLLERPQPGAVPQRSIQLLELNGVLGAQLARAGAAVDTAWEVRLGLRAGELAAYLNDPSRREERERWQTERTAAVTAARTSVRGSLEARLREFGITESLESYVAARSDAATATVVTRMLASGPVDQERLQLFVARTEALDAHLVIVRQHQQEFLERMIPRAQGQVRRWTADANRSRAEFESAQNNYLSLIACALIGSESIEMYGQAYNRDNAMRLQAINHERAMREALTRSLAEIPNAAISARLDALETAAGGGWATRLAQEPTGQPSALQREGEARVAALFGDTNYEEAFQSSIAAAHQHICRGRLEDGTWVLRDEQLNLAGYFRDMDQLARLSHTVMQNAQRVESNLRQAQRVTFVVGAAIGAPMFGAAVIIPCLIGTSAVANSFEVLSGVALVGNKDLATASSEAGWRVLSDSKDIIITSLTASAGAKVTHAMRGDAGFKAWIGGTNSAGFQAATHVARGTNTLAHITGNVVTGTSGALVHFGVNRGEAELAFLRSAKGATLSGEDRVKAHADFMRERRVTAEDLVVSLIVSNAMAPLGGRAAAYAQWQQQVGRTLLTRHIAPTMLNVGINIGGAYGLNVAHGAFEHRDRTGGYFSGWKLSEGVKHAAHHTSTFELAFQNIFAVLPGSAGTHRSFRPTRAEVPHVAPPVVSHPTPSAHPTAPPRPAVAVTPHPSPAPVAPTTAPTTPRAQAQARVVELEAQLVLLRSRPTPAAEIQAVEVRLRAERGRVNRFELGELHEARARALRDSAPPAELEAIQTRLVAAQEQALALRRTRVGELNARLAEATAAGNSAEATRLQRAVAHAQGESIQAETALLGSRSELLAAQRLHAAGDPTALAHLETQQAAILRRTVELTQEVVARRTGATAQQQEAIAELRRLEAGGLRPDSPEVLSARTQVAERNRGVYHAQEQELQLRRIGIESGAPGAARTQALQTVEADIHAVQRRLGQAGLEVESLQAQRSVVMREREFSAARGQPEEHAAWQRLQAARESAYRTESARLTGERTELVARHTEARARVADAEQAVASNPSDAHAVARLREAREAVTRVEAELARNCSLQQAAEMTVVRGAAEARARSEARVAELEGQLRGASPEDGTRLVAERRAAQHEVLAARERENLHMQRSLEQERVRLQRELDATPESDGARRTRLQQELHETSSQLDTLRAAHARFRNAADGIESRYHRDTIAQARRSGDPLLVQQAENEFLLFRREQIERRVETARRERGDEAALGVRERELIRFVQEIEQMQTRASRAERRTLRSERDALDTRLEQLSSEIAVTSGTARGALEIERNALTLRRAELMEQLTTGAVRDAEIVASRVRALVGDDHAGAAAERLAAARRRHETALDNLIALDPGRTPLFAEQAQRLREARALYQQQLAEMNNAGMFGRLVARQRVQAAERAVFAAEAELRTTMLAARRAELAALQAGETTSPRAAELQRRIAREEAQIAQLRHRLDPSAAPTPGQNRSADSWFRPGNRYVQGAAWAAAVYGASQLLSMFGFGVEDMLGRAPELLFSRAREQSDAVDESALTNSTHTLSDRVRQILGNGMPIEQQRRALEELLLTFYANVPESEINVFVQRLLTEEQSRIGETLEAIRRRQEECQIRLNENRRLSDWLRRDAGLPVPDPARERAEAGDGR